MTNRMISLQWSEHRRPRRGGEAVAKPSRPCELGFCARRKLPAQRALPLRNLQASPDPRRLAVEWRSTDARLRVDAPDPWTHGMGASCPRRRDSRSVATIRAHTPPGPATRCIYRDGPPRPVEMKPQAKPPTAAEARQRTEAPQRRRPAPRMGRAARAHIDAEGSKTGGVRRRAGSRNRRRGPGPSAATAREAGAWPGRQRNAIGVSRNRGKEIGRAPRQDLSASSIRGQSFELRAPPAVPRPAKRIGGGRRKLRLEDPERRALSRQSWRSSAWR